MYAIWYWKLVIVGERKATKISEPTVIVMKPCGYPVVAFFDQRKDDPTKLIHQWKCHTAVSTLQRMWPTKGAYALDELLSAKDVGNVCEAYVEGKTKNAPHNWCLKSTRHAIKLVHVNIIGPINPPAMNGEKYVRALVDYHSGAVFASKMESRDGDGFVIKKMLLHAQNLPWKKP